MPVACLSLQSMHTTHTESDAWGYDAAGWLLTGTSLVRLFSILWEGGTIAPLFQRAAGG